MMSGCGILTNGKGTRREYGQYNLDALAVSILTTIVPDVLRVSDGIETWGLFETYIYVFIFITVN